LPADFDPEIYLQLNEDLRRAGVNPASHFLNHGMHEQRPWRFPNATSLTGIPRDKTKRDVLVVSHEASRTGAPILSLNIARALSDDYNVVVLLIGPGPLVEDFRSAGVEVFYAPETRGNAAFARHLIGMLATRYSFAYAVVNSIESRCVLPGLAEKSIGTVSLLHEFASYTRPKDAFEFSFFWTNHTVFSTHLTLKNALDINARVNQGLRVSVFPQGKCVAPSDASDLALAVAERQQLTRIMRPAPDGEASFVFLGAGTVTYRKGVDLFIEVASKVIRSQGGENCRFAWIGKGFDPEGDAAYSAYLADQIERAGLLAHVFIVDEVKNIETAYELSDALLLTSRLDPLPNVAIDSLFAGKPVICFEHASGIADFLSENQMQEQAVARYLDTADMADKVLDLVRSKSAMSDLGERAKAAAEQVFNMSRYISRIDELGLATEIAVRQEAEDLQVILNSECATVLHSLAPDGGGPAELACRRHIRSWRSGLDRRKPIPGFHPGMYAELKGIDWTREDPFANWLRNGRPQGPWQVQMISGGVANPPVMTHAPRVALHVHAYYPDLLPDIIERIERNVTKPDLFVSVNDEPSALMVRAALKDYSGRVVDIKVVPNRGRNIGPLLTEFGRDLVSPYDIVGHLHTKRSPHASEAFVARWRDFMLENLVGGRRSRAMMDRIVHEMSTDATISLVQPDDPHVVGWTQNYEVALPLSRQLGMEELPRQIDFPVGSMFWMRSAALARFVDLGLSWEDYPPEPLAIDGTLLHAIERLFGVAAPGTRVVATHTQGVNR
jgi:glycosyltransferase involved in cell wall biosynthesis